MKKCMDADNLHRRLAKILGQVQAIDRMIDEEIPCEDILSQLNAAKSALNKVGQVVLEGHIRQSVKAALEKGDPEAADYIASALPLRYDPSVEDSRAFAEGRLLVLSSFPPEIPISPISRENCNLMNTRILRLCGPAAEPINTSAL